MKAGPVALLVGLWLAACGDNERPLEVVKNDCLSDLNCVGKGVSCDLSTLQCVRKQTLEPYRVLLQVQPQSTTDLKDAGVTLVDQASFDLGMLEGTIQNKVLEVPAAVRVFGSVSALLDGKPSLLESEVTLTPRSSEAPTHATVVNTSEGNKSQNDAGVSAQINVLLNPDLEYDVRVQPLLSSSTKLPPLHEMVTTSDSLSIKYGDGIVARDGTLSSLLLTSWHDHRVRLESVDGQVVSSINEVDDQGSFKLYADSEVLDAPDKFKLVVGLDVFPRWQVKLALDGTHFVSNAPIVVPDVPETVTYHGTVEDDGLHRLPFANLLFLSDFPVPTDTAYVGEADWCRLRSDEVTPTIRCSAEFSSTTDTNGGFNIDLIPGTYRLFVTPNRQPSDMQSQATHTEPVTVERALAETVDNGQAGNKIFTVGNARRYRGTLLSPQGRQLPNVTVNARAWGLIRPETGELGKYNRSMTTSTDGAGRFAVFADVGVYDLSFEPAAESGFAWVVCINRLIKADERRSTSVSLRPVRPSAPVYITGTVQHGGAPLRNARIEAYAVAKDLDDKPRTVLVGRATSDEQGAYRLAMPPRGGEIECPPTYE